MSSNYGHLIDKMVKDGTIEEFKVQNRHYKRIKLHDLTPLEINGLQYYFGGNVRNKRTWLCGKAEVINEVERLRTAISDIQKNAAGTAESH